MRPTIIPRVVSSSDVSALIAAVNSGFTTGEDGGTSLLCFAMLCDIADGFAPATLAGREVAHAYVDYARSLALSLVIGV